MIKNKDFFKMIIITCITVAVSAVIGFCFGGLVAGCTVLLTGTLLCIVFALYTRKRYKDIDDLNTYLSKVLSGNDVPDIADQEEGEQQKDADDHQRHNVQHPDKVRQEIRGPHGLLDLPHMVQSLDIFDQAALQADVVYRYLVIRVID